jgi:competence protein ComEA
MMIQNSNEEFYLCDSDDLLAQQNDKLSGMLLAEENAEDTNQTEGLPNRQIRLILLLSMLAAFLSGVVITYAFHGFASHGAALKQIGNNTSHILASDVQTQSITVDVHGDVVHPGVYHLSPDSRVLDAILSAGGYVHKEDSQFVNQAEPLVDGQEIIVPSPHAATAQVQSSSAPEVQERTRKQPVSNKKIDLNTADEATLETVPGIGPTKALAIIEFRKSNGPFVSLSELEQIRGFGKMTLSNIQPYLFVQSSH